MAVLEVDLRAIVDLVDSGDYPTAQNVASGLLREHPNNPAVIATMAYVLYTIDEHGLGYNLMRRVIDMLPSNSIHLNSMGMHALGCMDYDEAESYLRRSLKSDPENWRAMSNLALTCVHKCQPWLALEWANKALRYVPDDENIREIIGYAHLMMGRWEEGFRNYEYCVGSKVRAERFPQFPRWQGEACETLIVQGEQGIGDEVSFASVVPSITGAGRVILECDSRLEGLFRRSFGCEVYGTRGEKSPEWLETVKNAKQCLIGSLSTHYRKADGDFPGTPYLVADPERRIQWRALLASLGPRPKVGLAWRGGRAHTRRKHRSLRLEELLPILRQGCEFISLEYQTPGVEIEEFEKRHGIKVRHWDRATQSRDYDDTAALVAELDLIISVQTAIVHLAGGLGKETWVLVPRLPLWRYGLQGETMPLYKIVKLFRQKAEWAGPINRVAESLGSRLQPQ